METQVRTPQMVFMQPQRLIVPLFQRPYVWNQENQWEPLWDDVVRVADRLLLQPEAKHQPHFLGAIVLQQRQNAIGMMQERTVIDGQQRLTTLQLLLDALRMELLLVDARPSAMRIEALVANPEHFRSKPEDRFKVWPTNRDRAGFNDVMQSDSSVERAGNGIRSERIPEAHGFFREQAHQWLTSDDHVQRANRAVALETVVRELLQMVVIELAAEENAQEIFETLNARGAQLTAADLIKNFIFQRLLEKGTNVEDAYEKNWREFETGFWEKEISVGRIKYPRSSIFLNHWLIARTGEEVVAREVFARFKRFADYDAAVSMATLLEQVRVAAGAYRRFVDAATLTGPIDRIGLFSYRTSVLESEVIKPFVLYLLDPDQPPVPEQQLIKALDVVESWMVRRMLIRATTKDYNHVISEMVMELRKADRSLAGDVVEAYLARQSSGSRYWPDDVELREDLQTLLAYRRLGRGRLRMVLEAIEDYVRGWSRAKQGMGGERVARGGYAIEHVMPRKWADHWPSEGDPADRDRLIHTLGNLTLLTSRLNAKVSNGPWLGDSGKRAGLEGHDVLLLNRELLKKAGDRWNEEAIRQRTLELADIIIQIWPVPENHRSGFSPDREKARPRKKIRLADLINRGVLTPGMTLYPRGRKFGNRVATLLPDGQIEIDGLLFASPSPAAVSITGRPTNGWWFFLVDQDSRRSLRSVRRDYINDLAVDADEDEDQEDDDEA